MNTEHPITRQITRPSRNRACFGFIGLACAMVVMAVPALAQQPSAPPATHEHRTEPKPAAESPAQGDVTAPRASRSPDYSEGYKYTGMPGFEKTDQIVFGTLLLDEVEFLSGNEGEGANWTAQATYGRDLNKLWLRTQGLGIKGEPIDPTTGIEVFWWRASSPFWGTLLGGRQDFGPGAHTWLAFGVEGLAPYWFAVQATGYLAEDGRVSARIKTSYDALLTNRLIVTPQLESNVYSRAEPDREIGRGLGNIELGLRLRYEFHRKFAPYIGYVWERSFAGTARLRRGRGDPVTERRIVAGLRIWR